MKYFYNADQKFLVIKINKNYFINEIKMTEKELFNIAIAFQILWEG